MSEEELDPGLTRAYVSQSRRAHFLPPWTSPNSFSAALCGLSPDWPHHWFGTGTWQETERAKELTLCKACRKLAAGWTADHRQEP